MTNISGAISGRHAFSVDAVQFILDHKYGRAGDVDKHAIFQIEYENLIHLQQQLGFPVISTGQFGLEDLLRPFTNSLPELGGLQAVPELPIVRFHYTNTFYRQPKLLAPLSKGGSIVQSDSHPLFGENSYIHEAVRDLNAKIILPGPYSFASLIDRNDQPLDDVILDAAELLSNEIASLPDNYKLIQLDEPSLVWTRFPREFRDVVEQAYEIINQQHRSVLVHTYFESVETILPYLLDLPIAGIGVDFYKTNAVALQEYNFSGKYLQAGLVDAQNFVLEAGKVDDASLPYLADIAKALLDLDPDELVIVPNASLEYLPRKVADEKLKHVAQVVNLVGEN